MLNLWRALHFSWHLPVTECWCRKQATVLQNYRDMIPSVVFMNGVPLPLELCTTILRVPNCERSFIQQHFQATASCFRFYGRPCFWKTHSQECLGGWGAGVKITFNWGNASHFDKPSFPIAQMRKLRSSEAIYTPMMTNQERAELGLKPKCPGSSAQCSGLLTMMPS